MSQIFEVKANIVSQTSTNEVGSWTHISTPTNPETGSSKLYFKTDGNLYKLSSLGGQL